MDVYTRIEQVRGRILDLDTHEAIPRTRWETEFGDVGRAMIDTFPPSTGPNQAGTLDVTVDDTPIDGTTVWTVKGPRAPGASDLTRRIDVMAEMGVDRQLVFPGFVLTGLFSATVDEAELRDLLKIPDETAVPNIRPLADLAVVAHNEWVIRNSAISDRIRPVGIVLTSSIEEMVNETERLITAGVRGIWIPIGDPPAGTSPADCALDPFYALLADANVPLLIHAGSDLNFYRTKAWKRNVPEFVMAAASAEMELGLDPWSLCTMHHSVENFFVTLVMGGVFERHPELRSGAIEYGAHWVGPMAERCDAMAEHFHKRLSASLSMKPSEYFRRNFRASLFDFERIDVYLDRYEMPEVYCFATDYPHVEGGREPIVSLARRLERFDDQTFDNFFIHNAELLIPAQDQPRRSLGESSR